MFGMFKKKSTETKVNPGAGEPIISALLFKTDSFSWDSFQKKLAKLRFAGKPATNISLAKDVLCFNIGDELVACLYLDVPYPASDLEGPLATCWMWPEDPPISSVKDQNSHMLITLNGGKGDRIQRRLLLTAITAALTKEPGVLAVYWPEATQILFPPVFAEMAQEMTNAEAPPILLWVDIRAGKNEDDTTALFTTGLAALGLMEIEIPKIDMEPGEIREWMINIIYYLLEKGPVLKHGDTIGVSADHKVNILHTKSMYGHPGTVIRLVP